MSGLVQIRTPQTRLALGSSTGDRRGHGEGGQSDCHESSPAAAPPASAAYDGVAPAAPDAGVFTALVALDLTIRVVAGRVDSWASWPVAALVLAGVAALCWP